MYYADVGEVDIDENDNIIVKREIFENLLEIARNHCNLRQEITKLRKKCKDVFGNSTNPITEPAAYKELCMEAGVSKIFPTILDAMKNDFHSDKRRMLN